MFKSLKKEIELAQDLQSNGIVIHCGATKSNSLSNEDNLQYIVESINKLNSTYPQMQLLLENTTHTGKSYGGDIENFSLIMKHVEKKSLVGFCIDTAHSFVYGYDLASQNKRNDFLKLINDSLGSENIKLLHLNDSLEKCGSYIDKHEAPGEGLIGSSGIKDIMNSSLFQNVPIIMELPEVSIQKQSEIIHLVRSWQDQNE